MKDSDVEIVLHSYKTRPTLYWKDVEKKSLEQIFKVAATETPAYKKFLSGQGININKIKSYQDINVLPAISKTNYFWRYPLIETAIKGSYEKTGLVMTSTSGSTGHPTYFPRNLQIDWQYSVLAEFFLTNSPSEPTLLINCFGMGVWIGGLITYQAFRLASLRNKPLTIITPGINKKEIFHALRELAPQFKQVIIAGYPPFVKDLLDESLGEKINFKKFKLRLLFAAESFSETFRDYVCKIGKINNSFFDTLNIYGSAELGAMAFETPGSIFIRRLALKHPKILQQLFPQGGLPTLAQYNPEFVQFQEREGRILISALGPTPFLHYDIGDNGNTYTLEDIEAIFKEYGINLIQEAKKLKIDLLHLPFVCVHVRSDFATKLYGAIIHPQPISEVLQQNQFKKSLTGKFTLLTKSDNRHNQFLEINLELMPKIVPGKKLADKAKRRIIEMLLKHNAEYKNNYQSIPKKVTPVIRLWAHESPEYFKPGIKQKWVIK